ncbi:MAG: toprim domain-containing protein [Rhizobiales bacterium]|nr:toprim domain-containing protein [Hyphomicrobiales bacterium]
MNNHSDLTYTEIVQDLKSHVDVVVKDIFPNAVKHNTGWAVGSLAGEKGSSLSIRTTGGTKAGNWSEFGGGGEFGDIGDLVRLGLFDGDRKKAIDWMKSFLGYSSLDRNQMQKKRRKLVERKIAEDENDARAVENKRKAALGIFINSKHIGGTLAERYLLDRQIEKREEGWPRSLKFHEGMWHGETKKKHPCLIACIYDGAGNFKTIHRIYLQVMPDGTVKKLQNVKKAKLLYGAFAGGFVPICKGNSKTSMKEMRPDEKLMICEGIEDALILMFYRPSYRIIAAVSLGNIGAIAEFLPETCRHVTLFKDNDDSVAANDGFARACKAHAIAGRKVVISSAPLDFKDVNDWLKAIKIEDAATNI